MNVCQMLNFSTNRSEELLQNQITRRTSCYLILVKYYCVILYFVCLLSVCLFNCVFFVYHNMVNKDE